MHDERCFYSQGQKFNSARKNSANSVIKINENKDIHIDVKTIINDNIQTNVDKNNCQEESVTNIDNNNTILQVNVDNNETTPKHTLEHQNNDKDNDQEKIKNNNQEKKSSSQNLQNAPSNEKETLKKTMIKQNFISRL